VVLLSATACGSSSDTDADTSADAPVAVADDTAAGTTTVDDTPTASSPDATAPDATTGDAAQEPAPTDAPVAVPQALQFTAPLVGGGTFDGAAYAGKPTVFWFWAPT
jgi:hypothetical protein